MPKLDDLVFTRIKGQNNADPPHLLEPGYCLQATNVDFYKSALGRKRSGSASVSLTGVSFTGPFKALARFIADRDEGSAELFAVDSASPPVVGRLAGGTSWASVTLKDNISGDNREIRTANLNNKLFFAYNSTVNRLHVWDGSTIRRVGIDKAGDPSVADTGSGSYAATLRYYKVAYTVQASGVTTLRGELSDAVSFTPSGSGASARVSQNSGAPGEGETHWEIYGSADDATYFLLSTVAIGTTTYDDSTAPGSYSGAAPPSLGLNKTPPSARFLLADDSRLIMAGNWETTAGNSTTPKNNRVWWTQILGTNNVGDDERVVDISGVTNSYLDVEEPVRALGGPIMGGFYVWSYRRMWKFVQTGSGVAPYQRVPIGPIGCVDDQSVVLAEDEQGNPAVYWWAKDGPRRIGPLGLANLSDDIRDEIEDIEWGAAFGPIVGVYYQDKKQIWWWVATASGTAPNKRFVFHTDKGEQKENNKVRYGWSIHTGDSCKIIPAVMFSKTLGASMSADLVPYVGRNSGTDIQACDTGTDDAGTTFKAEIKLLPVSPWGLGSTGFIHEDPYLVAEASAGVTITLTVDRDYGVETLTSSGSIAAGGSETRVRTKFEATDGADMEVLTLKVGDSAAASNAWNLDALVCPVSQSGRDGTGD